MLDVVALALATLALMTAVGLGVVLGYHRLLTHKAARFHPVLEKSLVLCGLATGTPVQWVGNHRFHHAHVDDPDDPHSPLHRGFLIAHCGWYLGLTRRSFASSLACLAYMLASPARPLFDAFWRPRTNQQHVALAADIAADPFYAWLSRPGPYAFVLLAWVALVWSTFALAWGAAGVAVVVVVHYLAYFLGDGVNSLGHMWGSKAGASDAAGEARDNALLALVTFGDGWHRSHHANPGSIRAGRVDVAYFFTRACAAVGLARDLRLPR